MAKKDPELVDDRYADETDDTVVEVPEYDHSQFELPDDYEYTEEKDGEPDA